MTRYPLTTLRTLRAEEEHAAREALARAVDAVEAARAALRDARAQLEAHDAETRRILDAEDARALSAARVGDALRAQAFRERRWREREPLVTAVARAQDAERAAERAAEDARAVLAAARVEREAVERHHAAWADAERRRAESALEAETDDLAAHRPARDR